MAEANAREAQQFISWLQRNGLDPKEFVGMSIGQQEYIYSAFAYKAAPDQASRIIGQARTDPNVATQKKSSLDIAFAPRGATPIKVDQKFVRQITSEVKRQVTTGKGPAPAPGAKRDTSADAEATKFSAWLGRGGMAPEEFSGLTENQQKYLYSAFGAKPTAKFVPEDPTKPTGRQKGKRVESPPLDPKTAVQRAKANADVPDKFDVPGYQSLKVDTKTLNKVKTAPTFKLPTRQQFATPTIRTTEIKPAGQPPKLGVTSRMEGLGLTAPAQPSPVAPAGQLGVTTRMQQLGLTEQPMVAYDDFEGVLYALRMADYTWDRQDGSGTFGAYVFDPKQYAEAAKKVGVDPNDHTPSAQDKVARYMVGRYSTDSGGNWKTVVERWWGGKTIGEGEGAVDPGKFWTFVNDRIVSKSSANPVPGLEGLGGEISVDGTGTGTGSSGSSRPPLVMELSNPIELKSIMESVAPKVLGRSATDAEMDSFVKMYQAMEKQYQQRGYGLGTTGGTVTGPPNAASAATQSLRESAPTEVGAQRIGDTLDIFKKLVTTPVVSGF